MTSRFAAGRVRPAHKLSAGKEPRAACWLLAEWPLDAEHPTKYFFSNQPPSTSIKHLVRTAKNRWWIEHSDRELKDELGLDHFEGRSWQGWHHHVVLVLLAYAFLQALRRQRSKKAASLTLPRLRQELQQLLACWHGRCPLCRQTVINLRTAQPP